MERMPSALRERLGDGAALALEEYAEAWGSHWTGEVMHTAADRFDSRLVASAADLRVEMATLAGNLRGEMATLAGNLRGEMATLAGNLRGEMTALAGDLRGEMAALRGDLRGEMADLRLALGQEMHSGLAGVSKDIADLQITLQKEMSENRVELLRWSFLFWIGQVAVVAGLLAFMLRGVSR